MARLLGDEYPNFADSYQSPTLLSGLRINPIKDSRQAVLSMLKELLTTNPDHQIQPVAWCPTGYWMNEGQVSGRHPYHAAGLYYIQEPSAMAVAEILAPEPGERVLDLSAAPGGKATHLAGLMQNQGLLVANEIHPKRVWELVENLERWGTRNAIITQETPKRLAEHFGAFFDRVLLDAPCSGEGMFRKSPTAMQEWSVENVKSCAVRQSLILEDACRLVRPGGWLAYSTCTFNPYENEAVIARFLEEHPDFSIEPVPPSVRGTLPGSSNGKSEWAGASEAPEVLFSIFRNGILEGNPITSARQDLTRTVRFWPHTSPSEGHFIALMRRTGGISGHPKPAAKKHPRQWKIAIESFQDFCVHASPVGELLIDPARLALVENYIYYPPEASLGSTGSTLPHLPPESTLPPDLSGLKVIRPGWWLGTIKSGHSELGSKGNPSVRFEPSHALALAVQPQDAMLRIDFGSNSPEITAYLRGETLPLPGEDGWGLVCVDGFPLGWARRSANMLKNHYPRHLRAG